jgi:hypothetical protein
MIVSPQTPRIKTKLSLDIPPGYSSYSNTGSPTSPGSPVSFVASPGIYASPRNESSVPASPTFSGSWNVNKSQAELTVMLKEAYSVIREREKGILKNIIINFMGFKRERK